MDMRADRERMSAQRRQFLADTARTACGAALASLGLMAYVRRAGALPANALRPPAALAEADFLGACVRCGLCVRECPYDILSLAPLESPVATGTPMFTARTGPCEMCKDIPCVKACPTDALNHDLTDIAEAEMGLAALSDHETCLNVRGIRCDACFRACPLSNKALTLEPQYDVRTGRHARFVPTVHSDHCTGCGKCEHACVLDEAAIRVFPLKLAKGSVRVRNRLVRGQNVEPGKSSIDGRAAIQVPRPSPETPQQGQDRPR